MTLKFTLDWNCLIDVFEARPGASSVLALIEAHRSKRADVAYTAVSAAENRPKGEREYLSYRDFKARLVNAEIDDLREISAPARIGHVYIGHAFIQGEDYRYLERGLNDIMFPGRGLTWIEHCSMNDWDSTETTKMKKYRVWRNQKCDVDSIFAHIVKKREVFVTSNTKDFQKHEAALEKFGCGRIVEASLAIGLI